MKREELELNTWQEEPDTFYDIDEMIKITLKELKLEQEWIEPETPFYEYLYNAMAEHGGNLVPYTGQPIIDETQLTSAYPAYLPIPTI